MGDIADAMLDGTLCESCGVFIDSEPGGFPRKCHECRDADEGDYEWEDFDDAD